MLCTDLIMTQYSYEQELDFNEARADLDSVLQNIVAKANAGDESPEELDKKLDDIDSLLQLSTDLNKSITSDGDTPRKGNTKSSRKRRRKEEIKDDRQRANSCVMKLFDRSVDLAQFCEDTPLYPICREWMTNDPHSKKINFNLTATKHNCVDNTEINGVSTVPPPNKPFDNFALSTYVSPRIPSPVPQPPDKLESYLQNSKPIPRAETLLINHLQHWKAVREKWIARSNNNENRYNTGMSILKEMTKSQNFTGLSS